MAWWASVVVALSLVVASFIHGGIYTMVIAGSGGGGEGLTGELRAWRLNKFTGDISVCVAFQCRPVKWTEVP